MILSICIPTYNRIKQLNFQLNSIFSQVKKNNLFKDIEVVVGENSDDQNKLIKNSLITKFKLLKLKIIRNKKNIGYANNLNKLIKNSKGKYCWFLSDDDYLRNNALKTIINNLKFTNFDYITFKSGGRPGYKKAKKFDMYFSDIPGKKKISIIAGNKFLKKYWLSVIFISINVFNRKKMQEHILKYNLKKKINIAYHNSFLCLSFIKNKNVMIINEFLVDDSYDKKNYTFKNQYEMWVNSWYELIYALKKFNIPSKTIYSMRLMGLRNFKSMIIFFLQYHFAFDNNGKFNILLKGTLKKIRNLNFFDKLIFLISLIFFQILEKKILKKIVKILSFNLFKSKFNKNIINELQKEEMQINLKNKLRMKYSSN